MYYGLAFLHVLKVLNLFYSYVLVFLPMAELLLQIDQWLITFCLNECQQFGLSL